MTKRSLLPHSRRHLLIYNEDWDFLDQTFGPNSESRYGTGRAIKEMIHKACGQLKARRQQVMDRTAPEELLEEQG